MKRLACVVAAVSLALVGCGGSLCSDLVDAYEGLDEKGKACGGETEPGEETITEEQCEEALEQCTDDDKETLQEFADCVNDVPACKAGGEQAYGTALLACFFAAEGELSAACNAAEAEQIRRVAYGYSRAR